MKINLFSTNESLIGIFTNPEQIITMDANFLIPPDRSRYAKRSFTFSKYKEVWLDPIFATFSNLSIHEAVEEELVTNELKSYINLLKEEMHPKLLFILIRILQKWKVC